ncbi:MAG: HepT-like ribonuclease domain-containing protein [Geminicoccaceae bacterium]
MSPSELSSRLEDILEAIKVIGTYTSGKTQDDYAAERISEASRHIPRAKYLGIPCGPWHRQHPPRHACPIVG